MASTIDAAARLGTQAGSASAGRTPLSARSSRRLSLNPMTSVPVNAWEFLRPLSNRATSSSNSPPPYPTFAGRRRGSSRSHRTRRAPQPGLSGVARRCPRRGRRVRSAPVRTCQPVQYIIFGSMSQGVRLTPLRRSPSFQVPSVRSLVVVTPPDRPPLGSRASGYRDRYAVRPRRGPRARRRPRHRERRL